MEAQSEMLALIRQQSKIIDLMTGSIELLSKQLEELKSDMAQLKCEFKEHDHDYTTSGGIGPARV